MKKLISLVAIIAATMTAGQTAAQTFPVTLKVIDMTSGSLTNDAGNNNETNLYAYVSEALRPSGHTEWWVPFYTDGGITNGLLNKLSDRWEWTYTINAAPGDYEWNPGLKSLGWKELNKMKYYFGEGNRKFTIAADGTISGENTVTLKSPTSNTHSVTLKFTDYTKTSNDPANNNQTNIVFEGKGDMYAVCNPIFGDWRFPLYAITVNGTNYGAYTETAEAQVWEMTLSLKDNTLYGWAPYIKSWGWQKFSEGYYKFNDTGEFYFLVNENGTINGLHELVKGEKPTAINPTSLNAKCYLNEQTVVVESEEIITSALLRNTNGQQINQFAPQSNTLTFSIQALSKGAYFLQLNDGASIKIVKTN